MKINHNLAEGVIELELATYVFPDEEDHPLGFKLTLSYERIQQIQALAAIVRSNGLAHVAAYDDAGEWLDDAEAEHEDHFWRMQGGQILVNDRVLWYKAFLGDDDAYCETEQVELADLAKLVRRQDAPADK